MRKLPDNLKLKPRFTFRCTDAEYKQIKKIAHKYNWSANEYLLVCQSEFAYEERTRT